MQAEALLSLRRPRRARPSEALRQPRFATVADLLAAGRAALGISYERQSADARKKSDSVPNQRKFNIEQIDRLGLTLLRSMEDRATGASPYSRGERTGYGELLELIDSETPPDFIAIREITRSQREVEVFIDLKRRCLRAGVVYWLVAGRVYDLRDPGDDLNLTVQTAVGQHQAATIHRDAVETFARNVDVGRPHGKAPFGFIREYDPHTRKLLRQLPDEEVRPAWRTPEHVHASPAGIVRWICAELLRKRGLMAIANDLNSWGVPPPRLHAATDERSPAPPKGAERWRGSRWWAKTVRDLVRNTSMLGVRVTDPVVDDQGRELRPSRMNREGGWEALVSEQDFWDIQALLGDPRRRSKRHGWQAMYLLSGIGGCGVCGESLNNVPPRPPRQPRRYYQCRSAAGCCGVLADDLDGEVKSFLFDKLATEGFLDELGRTRDADSAAVVAARETASALRQALADMDASKDQNLGNPGFSYGQYVKDRSKLIAKITEAETQARRASLPPALWRFAEAKDAVGAARIWSGLDLSVQRDIVGLLLEVHVLPVGRGRRGVPVDQRIRIELRIGS